MARDEPMVHVRVPPWLKSLIIQEASANARTINAEILFRLRQAYDRDEDGVHLAAFRKPKPIR